MTQYWFYPVTVAYYYIGGMTFVTYHSGA